jgi:methyltransferase (TIGR00027 family)
MVAAARALGAQDPDPGVRNPDHLAAAFIGPPELALIAGHPISKILELSYEEAIDSIPIATLTSMMVFRTRFIDQALERAVANGITQVVILGAGFDSRAYRFAGLLQHCRVVEIDALPTQDYKKRRVVEALGELPPHVHYAPADFARETLSDVLQAAGLRNDQKTCFIWEGVTMYLPEASVRGVLETVARYAPGTTLLLDYVNSHGLAMMGPSAAEPATPVTTDPGFGSGSSEPASSPPIPSTGGWGEPWLFAVPGNHGADFFRELGFDPGTPLSTTDIEAIKRYAVRADGRTYAAETMEKMRLEFQARFQANPTSPENLAQLESWKAITAAGGFYWFAELTVLGNRG